jgi:hypothetical protein
LTLRGEHNLLDQRTKGFNKGLISHTRRLGKRRPSGYTLRGGLEKNMSQFVSKVPKHTHVEQYKNNVVSQSLHIDALLV